VRNPGFTLLDYFSSDPFFAVDARPLHLFLRGVPAWTIHGGEATDIPSMSTRTRLRIFQVRLSVRV
jgi:hypothetical protein